MNPIEDQVSLISELVQIMRVSVDTECDSMSCRFKYDFYDDGSASVDATFSYVVGGENQSSALAYPERSKLMSIVPKLHSVMREHTGGNWKAFTLNIDDAGEVKTRFEY